MSEKLKEELMSLAVCMLSIFLILMSLVNGVLIESAELYILHTLFLVLLSMTTPFHVLGFVILSVPLLYGLFTGSLTYPIVAEMLECATYFCVGSLMSKSMSRYTTDGQYMQILGYQVFIITCGNIAWFIIMALSCANDTTITMSNILLLLLQRFMITMLHMLACNKIITNYYTDRYIENEDADNVNKV